MREPDDLIVGGVNAYGIALNWLAANVKPAVKQAWEKLFFEDYEKNWNDKNKVCKAFHYACEKSGINIPLYNEGDYV